AMARAEEEQAKGFSYSYDMLGEAARTERDAKRYHIAYAEAITALANVSHSDDIKDNPGISIKLSALHPRYENLQRNRVMNELMPRARSLAVMAKSAGIGLNIDAEEAARLDISLDVIEAILRDPVLAGWNGFGIVVQAYSKRASYVIDWLYALAKQLDRQIMVRLVKGAYWDTEIKHAQVEGHEGFPVFTRKAFTDVSYIYCAQKLLGMTENIYPQFATHSAHSAAAILELAEDKSTFEFQRLHGMGEALHNTMQRRQGTRCRIYAPVGQHKDLLAYLVRRLLENGANSSFVNQIVDETVRPEIVAADPFQVAAETCGSGANPNILQPKDLFAPARMNSKGWDLSDPGTIAELESGIAAFTGKTWRTTAGSGLFESVLNPATGEPVGEVRLATKDDVSAAVSNAETWENTAPTDRAAVLRDAADLYEKNALEIFALLMREAGKTIQDCVNELREAVDFLRFYAAEAERLQATPMGVFACISPWNFPLAIFTGQISAALAAGNAVLAKPAESTPLIAHFAVQLLYQAGVPQTSLHLLLGPGIEIGAAITANPNVSGVCFTGATDTAHAINRSMATHLSPWAPLIAETGGLNAMIVDSTALPEQAIRDVLASAFQSAGQRCSALRILYLQEDVAGHMMDMLFGAMDELRLGTPTDLSVDIGPVIDANAKAKILQHIDQAKNDGRLLKQLDAQFECGYFVGPAVIRVDAIDDLQEEIFGPVLHVATFPAGDINGVIEAINATGYGLTFGMHSRIDDRVQLVVERVMAGNIYVNRNQIGAVVGSQPFGGEGLSGTGPKAGGPNYLPRFMPPAFIEELTRRPPEELVQSVTLTEIEDALAHRVSLKTAVVEPINMPGPCGESNRLSLHARDRVLCLGPGALLAEQQAQQARSLGCNAVAIAPGVKEGVNAVFDVEILRDIPVLD
ncbi:MAG: bifunctional proline dehydrogenase/L-glutamate gamma-semialdehyde dehydrogenase PutA, partial [Pseudomonadales bacterium]